MEKTLNRIVLVSSLIIFPFDVASAIGGSEASFVWALLMFIFFINAVHNELEWRNK